MVITVFVISEKHTSIQFQVLDQLSNFGSETICNDGKKVGESVGRVTMQRSVCNHGSGEGEGVI